MESKWSLNVELLGVGGFYYRVSGTQYFQKPISWIAELNPAINLFGQHITHVAQCGKRTNDRWFNYGRLLSGIFVPYFDWIFSGGFRGFPYFPAFTDGTGKAP